MLLIYFCVVLFSSAVCLAAEAPVHDLSAMQLLSMIKSSQEEEEKVSAVLSRELYSLLYAQSAQHGDDDYITPENRALGEFLALEALRAKRVAQFAALEHRLQQEGKPSVILIGTPIKSSQSRSCGIS